MRALDEEERLLAAVAAHFLLVLGVVTPDAEDAADRKALARPVDRQRRRGPKGNRVTHEILEKARF
jgi:hypothetical protein